MVVIVSWYSRKLQLYKCIPIINIIMIYRYYPDTGLRCCFTGVVTRKFTNTRLQQSNNCKTDYYLLGPNTRIQPPFTQDRVTAPAPRTKYFRVCPTWQHSTLVMRYDERVTFAMYDWSSVLSSPHYRSLQTHLSFTSCLITCRMPRAGWCPPRKSEEFFLYFRRDNRAQFLGSSSTTFLLGSSTRPSTLERPSPLPHRSHMVRWGQR